jgi:glycosyltransferase involved in cell wall biosynthesis
MSYHFGFLMDQIAGHITNYRNLRSVAERDPDIRADWHELHYHKPGGRIERGLAWVPSSYVRGVARGTWEARKALRGPRPQALLSNASIGVFLTDAYRRTPTMLDFDCTPRQIDRMPAYGVNRDAPALSALKYRLSRRMYRSAVHLQPWSRWAARSVIEEYGVDPARVHVNPPGIDLSFWTPGPRSAVQGATRRVLFVGGDFRRKGGELLLRWHREQGAGTELHLVTRETVEAAPDVFVYPDMRPNTPQLRRLYHECDLFVLPSRGECFGIATVEAMGAGMPVVVTDVGGTADIVEDGANGLIVPADDGAAFGAAVTCLLADDARRRAMACRSRQIAEERFDLTRNARRTLDALKALADAPEGNPT